MFQNPTSQNTRAYADRMIDSNKSNVTLVPFNRQHLKLTSDWLIIFSRSWRWSLMSSGLPYWTSPTSTSGMKYYQTLLDTNQYYQTVLNMTKSIVSRFWFYIKQEVKLCCHLHPFLPSFSPSFQVNSILSIFSSFFTWASFPVKIVCYLHYPYRGYIGTFYCE